MKTTTVLFRNFIILWAVLTMISSRLNSQNVAITDDDGYSAESSAILDVKSDSKGLLFPRLTTAQRTTLASTAVEGLMVYDTEDDMFYYYDGTNWVPFYSNMSGFSVGTDEALFSVLNASGDTVFAVFPEGVSIQVGNGDAKGNRGGFAVGGLSSGGKLGSANYLSIVDSTIRMYVSDPNAKGNRGGFAVGGLSSKKDAIDFMNITPKNYFIGHQSGQAITTGLFNSFIGYQSGLSMKSGSDNTFIGNQSGLTQTTGDDNIYIGNLSGKSMLDGERNIYIGKEAGLNANASINTVAIGYQSGQENAANNNTFVGPFSGRLNTEGRENVYVGHTAGQRLQLGERNVIIGAWAGPVGADSPDYLTKGSDNVILGAYAGSQTTDTLGGCVLIGKDAGRFNSDHNRLFIDNSGTNSPLIWGDFENNILRFNGDVEIKDVTKIWDGTATVNYATGVGDLYVEDVLEVDDDVYITDNANISGNTNVYGNVGIGTTSASNKLLVYDNTASATTPLVKVQQNQSSGDAPLIFSVNSGDAYIMGIDASDSHKFKISDWGTFGTNDRLTILSDGKVGIGEAGPNTRLHVNSATAENPFRVQVNGSTKFFISADGGATIGAFEDSPPAGGLYVSGNTGIGINTPTTKFHVQRSVNSTATPANHVALIENTSTTEGGDVLAIKNGYTGDPTTGTNFITFFNGNDNGVGAIEGDGSGGTTYKSGSADYAEYLPKLKYNEQFEKGDIVAVKGGKITKNAKNADLFMAISSAPIVLGNNPGKENLDKFEKVGFTGQVMVKVLGKVNAGDYILASGNNDGTGIAKSISEMKGEDFGKIVGVAWESSKEKEMKLINVAIGVQSWSALFKEQQNRIDNLDQEVNELKELIRAFSSNE